MVKESDKSDSWGSLLINGILSKFNLVSEKKSAGCTSKLSYYVNRAHSCSLLVEVYVLLR